jgi:excisionase family DNA binding protein
MVNEREGMGAFMKLFEDIVARLDRIEARIGERSFEPMTCGEAAKYLKVSPSHIYRLTSQGCIPHYKPNGKKIYFNKEDLDGWIKHGRVLTKEEISEVADLWLSRNGRGRRSTIEATRPSKM